MSKSSAGAVTVGSAFLSCCLGTHTVVLKDVIVVIVLSVTRVEASEGGSSQRAGTEAATVDTALGEGTAAAGTAT